MQTVILTEHFLPAQGGSINWLVNTYSRYSPREVVCIAPQQPGDAEVDRTLPFRVERIPMSMPEWDPTVPVSLYRYSTIMWRVLRWCYADSMTQIHCAKCLPEGLVAWGVSMLKAVPYLVYAHGEEILIALTSRKCTWLLPKIYRGAAVVIANSSHTKALLQDVGVESDKIHVIHPGVNLHAFRVGDEAGQGVRQQYRLGQAPILLTVGRMQRRKGQDMVIRALPHIQEEMPQVKYVLVGTGEDCAYLEALAHELGVTESVIFAGSVSDHDLASYYAACDLFIMPNRQIGEDIEGFGMVYLEAGAARKPVIGGISGGTEDAIVDGVTGLRIDGNSLEAIAEAVLSLLTNPPRAAAMGEAGRRRVATEFTWEAVVQQTRLLSASIVRKT